MHNKQYPLGFILSLHGSELTPFEHYQHYQSAVNISYDPNNQFISYTLDNTSLTIIGDFYSIGSASEENNIESASGENSTKAAPSSNQLAAQLFDGLLESETLFFQALKRVWGRFVLIYSTKTLGPHILTDATSMRGVFYSNKETVICASHPYMLGEKIIDTPFPIRYGYPGNLTPLTGVKILTPNTRLCLTTGNISRFYPGLMPMQLEKVKTAKQVAAQFIQGTRHILKQLSLTEPKICVTLTGGLDSRVTLALLLLAVPDKIPNIKFITYKNNNTTDFDTDIETATILAKQYHLDHVIFDRNEHYNHELQSYAINATYYHSGPKLLAGYAAILGKGYTHIRSNIYEVGRAFYFKNPLTKKSYTGNNHSSELSKIYTFSLSSEKTQLFYQDQENMTLCEQAFDDFFEQTQFAQAITDFHPLDIFYWEHRLGTWMPHVYLETDHVFNTLSLPNNWQLLEALIQLPLQQRLNGDVFNHILTQAAPFLTELPINPTLEQISPYLNSYQQQYSKGNKDEKEEKKEKEENREKENKGDSNMLQQKYYQSLPNMTAIQHEKNAPFSFNYNEKQHHQLYIKAVKTNILTHFKHDSERLVIFFNGAVNIDKTPLPTFQRHSWLEKLPYSSMIIMDPTIDALLNDRDTNYITWYQGDKDNFFLAELSSFIHSLIKKLEIKSTNVIFYGSSAGGFAALISATLLKGTKACVVNPQINILKYYNNYVEKITKHLDIELNNKENSTHRLNATSLMENKNSFPQVYYKQNKKDIFHFESHYITFKEFYKYHGHSNKLISILTDDERGHSAVPLYDEVLIDLEKTYTDFNDDKIIIKHYGLTYNESNIYLFKPRKDNDTYKLDYPLNWNIDPFVDRNWCFQLNSWRHIDNTLKLLHEKFDTSLFLSVANVIFDWHRDAIIEKNLNDYTWYDMSTGLRCLKIALMIKLSYINSVNLNIKNMLLNIGVIHLNNIKKQELSLNNHGIFQAHGQAILAIALGDEYSVLDGVHKMELLLNQQFNSDGFHSENSCKYHWFVLNIFDNFLGSKIYQNTKKISNIIAIAKNNKKWTIFPNHESLMIGDSDFSKRNINFNIDNNNIDKYILKEFKESGYIFIRSQFNMSSEKSSMLFLQTAYKNNTHRHADDFNILLYEYGINILVDAGQYAYSNDKERGYALSTRAHNCLVVDKRNYNIKNTKYYDSALIYSHERNGVYQLKTSLNRQDISVKHSRVIIYKPGYFLVVIDQLHSDKVRQYDQWWHFHQDLELAVTEQHYLSNINDQKQILIKCMSYDLDNKKPTLTNNLTQTQLVKGQREPELQGWRSLSYRKLIPNYAMSNSTKAKNALLITQFLFTDNNKNNTLNIFIEENNKNLNIHIQELSSNDITKITLDRST